MNLNRILYILFGISFISLGSFFLIRISLNEISWKQKTHHWQSAIAKVKESYFENGETILILSIFEKNKTTRLVKKKVRIRAKIPDEYAIGNQFNVVYDSKYPDLVYFEKSTFWGFIFTLLFFLLFIVVGFYLVLKRNTATQ